MDYNELKKIAEQRHIMIKDIALSLGFSQNGLKVSFVNGTMPFSKVPQLCKMLDISISQFYGEEPIADHKPVSYTQTGKNNTIAAEGSSVVFGSESEVQFLRQQVRQLTEMNRDLIKTMKK